MGQGRSSGVFLAVMVILCAITVGVAFMGPEPEAKEKAPAASEKRPSFQFSGREAVEYQHEFSEQGLLEEQERLRRQLQRRVRMERDGITRNIINNDAMPEEIRRRFRDEKARLDVLAEENPQLALQVANSIPRDKRFNEDGSVTPEFAKVMEMMESSGVVSDMSDSYLLQLEQAAEDPSLPASQRPSEEDLERARKEMHIPML